MLGFKKGIYFALTYASYMVYLHKQTMEAIMKTKTSFIILIVSIFCVFSSGYCLAAGGVVAQNATSPSKVNVASAQSVPQAQNADAAVSNVISVNNATESSSVTYKTSVVDNKQVVDITIPQGQKYIIDTPITADVVNIHGDGSLVVTNLGSINATDINITLAMISMGAFPQSDDNTAPSAGVNTVVGGGSLISSPVQVIDGNIKIPDPTPVNPVILPDPSAPGSGTTIVRGPIGPGSEYDAGGTIGEIVTVTEGTKTPPVAKNLIGVKQPRPGTQERVGPNLGTTMDTPISTQTGDEKKSANRPTTYNPNRSLGGATIDEQTTVEENKIEE